MTKDNIAVILIGVVIVAVASLFIFGILRLPQRPETTIEETAQTQNTMANQDGELKIEDIEVGTGETVESGDTVVIHYTGTLTDGTKFDSSVDRGEPFQTDIGVGQVIEGWDKGVVGMKVGGKRKLTIPPSMAYGDQEIPGIPANSTLIFDVELLEVLK